MSSPSDLFSYGDEIGGKKLRLVQLKWGPKNSIYGKIRTVSLSPKQRPIFMAASYFCGSKFHDKPIYLKNDDSKGAAAAFRVYESLYPLLELFCDRQGFEPELWWWIDSICINKHSAKEKEAQVKAMKDIYAAAERTIIWLGTRSFDSDLAIDFLHELNTKRDLLEDTPQERIAFHSPELSYKWRAMQSLLDREWWRRVWTVQELLISPRATFYCGTKNFRKSKFQVAMYAMALCRTHDVPLIRNNVWDPAWNRRRMLQYYRDGKEMPIVGSIAFLSDNDATLPQDRIYALLGMMPKSDEAWLGEADYKRHRCLLTYHFAKKHIQAWKSLDLICFAHVFNSAALDTKDVSQFPSWVPDWRTRVRPRANLLMVSQDQARHIGNFRPLWMKEGEAQYRAAGSSEPQVSISDTDNTLRCEGVVLDSIDGLGALTDENGKCSFEDQLVQSTSPINVLKLLSLDSTLLWDSPEVQQLIYQIAVSLNVDRKDKHLLQKAPRSLPTDFIAFCLAARHFPDMVQPEFLSWFRWNQSLLIHGYSMQKIFSSVDLLPSADNANFNESLQVILLRFLRHDKPLEAVIRDLPSLRRQRIAFDTQGFLPRFHDTTLKWQRRLMVTGQGHIGMAPSPAGKDCVVAVLFGCSVPVVLRPLKEEGGYEFIGECYVCAWLYGR